jgi:MinD-like ATPase involved in chromosome partitioning or flagellar assembly
MRVFVLARTEHEITQQLYPALADTEARIVGYAMSTEGLAEQLEIAQPDRVLVRMTLCRPGEEEVFLERLARYRLIVVLPRGRGKLVGSLSALPHVEVLAVEPVDYAALLEKAAPKPAPPLPQDTENSPGASVTSPEAGERNSPASTSPSSLLPATPTERTPIRATHRVRRGRVIAFTSGMLGGTGKSTLSGNLAWLLAHEGKVTTILLCFGAPPAAFAHFKLARWPDLGLFLDGEQRFERSLQRKGSLAVGVTPTDAVTYERIGALKPEQPGAVLRAVEEAAARFELVIADLPPDSSGWAIHPVLDADDVVIVARPTVADQAGLVQTVTLLQALHHGRETPLHLILNDRWSQDIEPEVFLTGAGQVRACPPLLATVPHNGAVRLAQNEGVPLPLAEGCDDVLTELRRLADRLGFRLPVDEADDAVKAPKLRTDRRPALSLPGVRFKLTD